VIALPPVLAGATQVTASVPVPPVAVTPVGAPGTVGTAVTVAVAAAAAPVPVPTALIAETVTVYVPAVRPEMVHVVAVAATVPQVEVVVPDTAETE
jgi:hypothetical protein